MTYLEKLAPAPRSVLAYWFQQIPCKQGNFARWFGGGGGGLSQSSEKETREHFLSLHALVKQQPFPGGTPLDTLASIIVLDQFSRELFKGEEESFANDPQALSLAKTLTNSRDFLNIEAFGVYEWSFALMPYMHSEEITIQDEGIKLFTSLYEKYPTEAKGTLQFAHEHREIIARFHRYPHRNQVLKRQSTPEELDFLTTHKGF
jgi:uncharacterized protein (DUF924 family)